MKILITLFLLAFPLMISAQVVRIPDPAFKQKLIALGYDLNDDGQIQATEAAKVTNLRLKDSGIVNIEGIKSFVNLQELEVPLNKIERLDVSGMKNLTGLYAWDNPLTEIRLTGASKLVNLHIHNNGGQFGVMKSFIRVLDVSTLASLEDLRCQNNLLTKLDVSGLNKLDWLDCAGNQLESVVLNKAPALKHVNLENNPIKNTVDIRGLTSLEYFNCKGCHLIYMNMTGTVSLKELLW